MSEVKCPNNRCEIPAGDIQMGSTNGEADEQPVRNIHISAFKLGKAEVTVGEYRQYLQGKTAGGQLQAVLSGCGVSKSKIIIKGRNGETADQLHKRAAQVFWGGSCQSISIASPAASSSRGIPNYSENQKGDNFPIVGLRYEAMQNYCQAQGGDLPTAAQIERASKGISGKDEYGTPIDKAIIYENGHQSTAPVCGSNDERANSFGVCDLAGNVWETTRDQNAWKFYSRMPSKDPHNPFTDPNTQSVELRGGSWSSDRWYARAAKRFSPLYDDSHDVGFRCAWPVDSGKVK